MDDMITTGMAAGMLGVSTQTIRRLIRQSKLAAMETEGGKFRVKRSSVEQYIQSRMVDNLKEKSQPQQQ